MEIVFDVAVICPHCGETHLSRIDTSQGNCAMIEDCSVCCAPMELNVLCRAGREPDVEVSAV